ncbi:MSHA pilin protein MshC [Photobacterium marinum]|uniref:MSHA pilin protein MshC n=1 Tax=Photobacterium marinum TaxID=1056511 RepID=L8JFP8_9GAMM|nr:prepilin-type N-terminal cleavage/methylation domain-containing protein [Photobacterium marinum]ELR66324.1 MSHA pilin protein MshC [Photobacterium marinum]
MPGSQRGFTLIELIVVIILIGIVSVTAASRLMGRSGFDAYLARDQAVSIVRQIQITAMQATVSQSTDFPLRIIAGFGESSSCMGMITGASCPSESEAGAVSRIVSGKTIHVRFSSRQNTIYFDLLGRPVDNSGQRMCQAGCQINLEARDRKSLSICINSEGFIGQGRCN